MYRYVTFICSLHVALKAAFFDYVWVADKWVAPLLFTVTIVACLGHVAVAFSMVGLYKLTLRASFQKASASFSSKFLLQAATVESS